MVQKRIFISLQKSGGRSNKTPPMLLPPCWNPLLKITAKLAEKFQSIANAALYGPENIYEGYGEIVQAQYLDPIIFNRVMKKISAYGLKETDLGNHVLLQLRNLTQTQKDEILLHLKNVSNEVGKELYEKAPHLYFLP